MFTLRPALVVNSRPASTAQATIPPRNNRIVQRTYDHPIYKDRNLVERFFNRIKQFRRIATRYDKLARNDLSP